MKDIGFNKSANFLDNELIIKHFFERSGGPAFLFAVSDSFHVRKQVNESVITYCKEKGNAIGIIALDQSSGTGFLTQLRGAKEEYPAGLIINNLDSLISATHGEFATDFNQMREGLIMLGIPMLIWLSNESHNIFTHKAIDLYLRRDLSTLFFEDPVTVPNFDNKERFTEMTRESANFEETRTRIALLEQQLAEARTDDFPKARLANEVVLPLIQAYVDNSMLIAAKGLLGEFESDFDYNKTDADNIIGELYEKTGDFDLAIDHYEKALNKKIKIFGEENSTVASNYNKLGSVLQDKGNLDEAIECLEKALRIDLKLLGEENAKVAIHYNNLGLVWQEKGDLDKAIEYLEKALKIDLKLFGEENPNVATHYNNFGLVWREKGNFGKAIEYYEKALSIGLKLFGEENPNVATHYNNLGLAWHGKGDLDIAIKYYEKAYHIFSELYGEDNPITKTAKRNYGECLGQK